MKKQVLGIIIVALVLVTIIETGCTAPITQNNTLISNVSKKRNDLARFTARNNITAQFNSIAGNASKTLNSTAHEVKIVVHFLNGLMQLITDMTRDLHSSASISSVSLVTIFPLQCINLLFEEE